MDNTEAPLTCVRPAAPQLFDTNDAGPVLTLAQAAAYLHVSKAHVSNVINGKVPGVTRLRCFRAGRRILIKREWLTQWMESADPEVVR
jgi:excisionase family DNA binding protein